LEIFESKELTHPIYESYKSGDATLEQLLAVTVGTIQAVLDPTLMGAFRGRPESEQKNIHKRFWDLFREKFDENFAFVTFNSAYIHLTKL